MVGVSKGKGQRGGFRVFRVHVDSENTERLRQLFKDFADGKTRAKTALCYRDEWMAEWGNVLRMCGEAGKRTMPKPPPIMLPLRFVMPDGSVRGNNAAPCVIDLRRGELRIPSYGVAVPLRRSIVEALIGENELEPRPEFALQVTRRGFVRIIARREVQAALALPLRVVALDENSSYGFALCCMGRGRCAARLLRLFEKLRPPNHGYRRGVAKLLQSYADKPSGEAKQQLAELLPEEVLERLTAERG
jgi:hypothetical protein